MCGQKDQANVAAARNDQTQHETKRAYKNDVRPFCFPPRGSAKNVAQERCATFFPPQGCHWGLVISGGRRGLFSWSFCPYT